MAQVGIEGDSLVVEIEGLDRLWALKSRLVIPLTNVRGATVDPGIAKDPKGIRSLGTHVPDIITAGTFRREGEQVFWDVRDATKIVVIELADEKYARLVIQVDDPQATVALIESVVTAK